MYSFSDTVCLCVCVCICHLVPKKGLEIGPDDFYMQQMSYKSLSSFSRVISMFVLIIKHVDLLEETHCFNMETLSSNIFQV